MKRVFFLFVLALSIIAANISAGFGDTLWDYQAVDSIGFGTHPAISYSEIDPASKIVVEGVALAGSDEILDSNVQYTVFIQDDTSDRGGLQAWTGSFFYSPSYWAALRITDYIDFQAGDRLRITGLLADMGRGKVVINNRGHSGAPYLVWHVDIIGHTGLPDPELIPSISHCNYFDQTRAGGGERYQTRYTMLHGVQIEQGSWANNSLMKVNDETGSVGMLLSGQGDFNSNPQPNGKLNVVGIFDQEDDGNPPYTDGYRIWVKKFSDVALALDACREVSTHNPGERVALINKVVSKVYDGYFYIQDAGRAGGVRVTSSRAFNPGDVVCVQGLISLENGENIIDPTYLTLADTVSKPNPVFVNSSALWGESGLSVNGLLVRVVGKVGTDQGNGIFSLIDDSGTKVIYVKTNGVTMPAQNTFVAVTAVVTNSEGTPLLLLAEGQDIQVIQ